MALLLFALFRAGFEPLSWRGDHGPSLELKAFRFSWAVSEPTPRLKTGADLAWQKNPTLRAPSFSPYHSRVPSPFRPLRRFAASPLRRGLPSDLTSSARTRKGKRNGKTIKQSRKTPSSSRLSSEKEKRRQSRQTLTNSP